MPKKTEKPLHIFIPEDWHEWLRDRAHEERVSIAELVRRALSGQYNLKPPDEGAKGGELCGAH
jgi:hypothetical protein